LAHFPPPLPTLGALRPNASQGLTIHEVSRSHTTTHHSLWDSSGRVISSSQRPLPHKTQHTQQASMPLAGFKSSKSAGERTQTHALDRSITGTGLAHFTVFYMYYGIRPIAGSLYNILCTVNTQHTSNKMQQLQLGNIWLHVSAVTGHLQAN